MLHTRFNRAFRFVCRFVSDHISDNFCIVCTQTAFFIEKQKALGDFQKKNSDNFCVVCTGPNKPINGSTYFAATDVFRMGYVVLRMCLLLG